MRRLYCVVPKKNAPAVLCCFQEDRRYTVVCCSQLVQAVDQTGASGETWQVGLFTKDQFVLP